MTVQTVILRQLWQRSFNRNSITQNAHCAKSATQNPKQSAKSIAIWVSVSKAAMVMLTQVLAVELGHVNVQVNAIAPGVIKTRFSQVLWQTPQIAEPILKSLPSGRFGEPEDVAGLALYLASPASDYVTGAVFVVDGGMNVATAM